MGTYSEQYAIEVRNLNKAFRDFCLRDISFDLPKGCILGLIGENGAGKSTTVRLIMNSLKKDSGSVRVLGVDNEDAAFQQVKNDIGIVLDEAYFPAVIHTRIVDKMMSSTYANWNSDIFRGYIRRLDLPENRPFKEYSRGMKMKLSIAVALSHDPKLLILDEATSGLDPVVRDEILDIFNDFTRDPEHSILISSHILSDLEKLCDYIAFIHKGKLMFCEEKDLLMEQYGLLSCSWKELEDIPREAVCGRRSSDYGVTCLVRRDLVSPAFDIEKATIEDIMLYQVKGENRK